MDWKFDSKLPIYSQLVEKMKVLIITGTYPPGSRVSSVRDLAAEAGVNPNTMQRALAELENQGLVFSQRTSGRFITEDTELIRETSKALAGEKVGAFVAEMKSLGLEKDDIVKLIEEYSHE